MNLDSALTWISATVHTTANGNYITSRKIAECMMLVVSETIDVEAVLTPGSTSTYWIIHFKGMYDNVSYASQSGKFRYCILPK